MYRKIIKQQILKNPFTLFGYLYPTKDNGRGIQVKDFAAVPVLKTYVNPVRIGYDKKKIAVTNTSSTPYSEETVNFLLCDHETTIDIGLEFEYSDSKFKVMKEKQLIKYGDVIGYEYELMQMEEKTIGT